MADTALPSGAVTFLFTDIEGSTPLWERQPDAMREALVEHDRIVTEAVRTHGGSIFKTGGDGFCVAFTDPHEALSAAIEAQRSLTAVAWATDPPIRVRMGLHTGTAHLRDGDYFGPSLSRASRLMDAGHGGQILLSATTQRLVVDGAPPEVTMRPLGTHHLRGLDRPEEIFQAGVGGLPADFPELRTATSDAADPAAVVAEAFQQKHWQEVFDHLTALERSAPLTGAQHEMLAESMWWLGRHQDLVARFEAASTAYLAEGDVEGAATTAVWVAELKHHELAPAVSRSWERKAEKLLEGREDSPAMGHLMRFKTVRTWDVDGDAATALDYARRVMEIATAIGDGDLEALALQDQGRILVATGEVEAGMAMMDEAMIAAVSGDVSPIVVGRSYCNMLAACDKTGDLRRATEWGTAAEQWCSENEHAPYPGVCRIFKAEVMWKKGDWEGARSEVLRASDELAGLVDVAGEAWYQYGEMLVRLGDEPGAEAAFQEALARGRQPVPGYATLLARRGGLDEAREMLARPLSEMDRNRLDRAKYLPALIDIELQRGAIDEAASAADDLHALAQVSGSEVYTAMAERALGRIALAHGDPEAAISLLSSALATFTRLGLPYEAALSHADIAAAHAASGSKAMAEMEWKVSLAELERLGAAPDVTNVRRATGAV